MKLSKSIKTHIHEIDSIIISTRKEINLFYKYNMTEELAESMSDGCEHDPDECDCSNILHNEDGPAKIIIYTKNNIENVRNYWYWHGKQIGSDFWCIKPYTQKDFEQFKKLRAFI